MGWSKTLNAFWMGAGSCEYIAWKGSHEVLEYDCEKYPSPPTRIIRHTKRIKTLEEFDKAINSGTWYAASYVELAKEPATNVRHEF